jgi:hypothetical protein
MMTNSELHGGNNGRNVNGLRRRGGMASFHLHKVSYARDRFRRRLFLICSSDVARFSGATLVLGRPPLGRGGLDMMSKPSRSRLMVCWLTPRLRERLTH